MVKVVVLQYEGVQGIGIRSRRILSSSLLNPQALAACFIETSRVLGRYGPLALLSSSLLDFFGLEIYYLIVEIPFIRYGLYLQVWITHGHLSMTLNDDLPGCLVADF